MSGWRARIRRWLGLGGAAAARTGAVPRRILPWTAGHVVYEVEGLGPGEDPARAIRGPRHVGGIGRVAEGAILAGVVGRDGARGDRWTAWRVGRTGRPWPLAQQPLPPARCLALIAAALAEPAEATMERLAQEEGRRAEALMERADELEQRLGEGEGQGQEEVRRLRGLARLRAAAARRMGGGTGP